MPLLLTRNEKQNNKKQSFNEARETRNQITVFSPCLRGFVFLSAFYFIPSTFYYLFFASSSTRARPSAKNDSAYSLFHVRCSNDRFSTSLMNPSNSKK